jgi:hypothetical protein
MTLALWSEWPAFDLLTMVVLQSQIQPRLTLDIRVLQTTYSVKNISGNYLLYVDNVENQTTVGNQGIAVS